MKTYFADTNFYLRFLLNDNQAQATKIEHYLNQARKEKIKIVYLPVVIIEMEVVLRRLYSQPRTQIHKQLLTLIKTPYLAVEDQDIWIKTFERFADSNIDLVDLFLFEKAQASNAAVLTFDKKLSKLKTILKSNSIDKV